MAEENEGVTENTESTENSGATLYGNDSEDKGQAQQVSEDTASEKEGDENSSKDSEGDKGDQKAPDKYEDFNIPEGLEADTEALGEFSEVAKELNLSQEQAQRLIDLQTGVMNRMQEAQKEAYETTVSGWLTEAKDDKEIGGENFDANAAVARSAIEKFGSDKLVEALDLSGLGNHPEMIRFAYKVGKAISDDNIEIGGQKKTSESKSLADRLYPNTNS